METRVDIEEAINLADKMPEKVEFMRKELLRRLKDMNASYPYFNPNYKHPLKNKDKVCRAVEHERIGNKVSAKFEENGANVTNGQIAYTLNGGEKSEEWYISNAVVKGNQLVGFLPEGTTHYVFNFVDENNFLVSYPEMPDMLSGGNGRGKQSILRRPSK